MKRIAVCPGSYDPITLGHADIIRRAAAIFGSCEVVVMENRDKKYRFTSEERLRLCKAAFEGEENITVSYYGGMLYEYLVLRPEAVLVKGVRNEKDFLYEKQMAEFNFAHCGTETLYLDAKQELKEISSTLVREKIEKNEDLSVYLPQNVVKLLQNKL